MEQSLNFGLRTSDSGKIAIDLLDVSLHVRPLVVVPLV